MPEEEEEGPEGMLPEEQLEQKIAECRANNGADRKTNFLASPDTEVCPYSVGYVIVDAGGNITLDHRALVLCPDMAESEEKRTSPTDKQTVWYSRICTCKKP